MQRAPDLILVVSCVQTEDAVLPLCPWCLQNISHVKYLILGNGTSDKLG